MSSAGILSASEFRPERPGSPKEKAVEKDGKFITKDHDVHRGRGWKMFDREGKRIGTYNEDLTIRIGP